MKPKLSRFLSIAHRLLPVIIGVGILALVAEILLTVREAEKNPIITYTTNTIERVMVQAPAPVPPAKDAPKAAAPVQIREKKEVVTKRVKPREPDFDWSKMLALSRLRESGGGAVNVFVSGGSDAPQPPTTPTPTDPTGTNPNPPSSGGKESPKLDSPYAPAGMGKVPTSEELAGRSFVPAGFVGQGTQSANASPQANQRGTMFIMVP